MVCTIAFHIIFINLSHHIEDEILQKLPYKSEMRFSTLKSSVSQNVGAQNQSQHVERSVAGSPNFETHNLHSISQDPICHQIVIPQSFVDLTENLNLVGWNAWNAWKVRRKFGDFVSHLNSMPWGHSPHISGSIGWEWWHDVWWLISKSLETLQGRHSHVVHHFRFQF